MKDIRAFVKARYNEELAALLLPRDLVAPYKDDEFNLRLADVQSKLQIVGLLTCLTFNEDDQLDRPDGSYTDAYWDVVRLLALPYAHHVDYDPKWTPSDE